MAQKLKAIGGLGNANDSDVLKGVTYTSDNGIKRTGTGGIFDYSDLQNKPQIGGVVLVGNKTLDELGIQPKVAEIVEEESTKKVVIPDPIVAPKVVVKEAVEAPKVKANEIEADNIITYFKNAESIVNIDLDDSTPYFVGTAKCKFYATKPQWAIAYYPCKNGFLIAGQKGVISLTDFNLKSGDDVTEAFEKIANYSFSSQTSVEIPAGLYYISRPITFKRSVVISGSGYSAFPKNIFTEYAPALKYVGTNSGYMFTLPMESVINNLRFVATNYDLLVDRKKYTGAISDVFTESVGDVTIGAIDCSTQLTLSNVSFVGFSDWAVKTSYAHLSNISAFRCRYGLKVGTDSILIGCFIRYTNIAIECNAGLLNCYGLRLEDVMTTGIQGSSASAVVHGIIDWCGGAMMTGSFIGANVTLLGRAACCLGEPDNALFRFTTQKGGKFEVTNEFNEIDGDSSTKVKVKLADVTNELNNVQFVVKSNDLAITKASDVFNPREGKWINNVIVDDIKNNYWFNGFTKSSADTAWFAINNVINKNMGGDGAALKKVGQMCKTGDNKLVVNINGTILNIAATIPATETTIT